MNPRDLQRRLDALGGTLDWDEVIRGRERLEANASDKLDDLDPLARDTARRLFETFQEMKRRSGGGI
ncbi:MAG: hypothetical protein ACK53T_12440 [Planctomycetota bacterium]